jgi:hypothetical protein
MKTKTLLQFACALIISMGLFLPALQPKAEAQGGRHPHYLAALSDLRLARGYLDKLTPSERLDETQLKAIHEIEEAIGAIKHASIDDGKNINDHVPIDARILPRSRYQKAREALGAALHDCGMEEDDPYTREAKKAAIEHIHLADHAVQNIMEHLHLM